MLAAPELPVADPRLSGPLDYLLYVPIAYFRSAEGCFLMPPPIPPPDSGSDLFCCAIVDPAVT